MKTFIFFLSLILSFSVAALSVTAGQALQDAELVTALRQGGYILYFRHAATDWSKSDQVGKAGDWWSCAPGEMRQLNDHGRQTAEEIGEALEELAIPIGGIYASEYCRARETAKKFGLGEVTPSREIMNLRAAEYLGGRQAVIERARRALNTPPPQGTNTIWVAHGNIVRAATGEYPGEAGCIIFQPRPEGTPETIGRIEPEQWSGLAADP